MNVRWIFGLAWLAGCGEGSALYFCDNIQGDGTCSDYVGAQHEDAVSGTCSGDLQIGECPDDDDVGTCFVQGEDLALNVHFYADGPEPFDAATAEATCGEAGGDFQAP